MPGLVPKAGTCSEKKTQSLSSQSVQAGGIDGLIAEAGAEDQL